MMNVNLPPREMFQVFTATINCTRWPTTSPPRLRYYESSKDNDDNENAKRSNLRIKQKRKPPQTTLRRSCILKTSPAVLFMELAAWHCMDLLQKCAIYHLSGGSSGVMKVDQWNQYWHPYLPTLLFSCPATLIFVVLLHFSLLLVVFLWYYLPLHSCRLFRARPVVCKLSSFT